MKIVGGFQNTKLNNEDFALTPYLFGVLFTGKVIGVIGIGMAWGFWAVYVGIARGLPRWYPGFRNMNNKLESPNQSITKP